mgnify:FL=1|jgi:hypothetical protein
MANTTFSGPVLSDNGFIAPTFTLATLPTATAGKLIYVSDATGASLTGSLCFGNGTNFVDVTTGAAVA